MTSSVFLCCAKKAMSLLEQYQVPQEKAVRLMKEIYGGFSRADDEVSAPILMADMMGILDANVGIPTPMRGRKGSITRSCCTVPMTLRRRLTVLRSRLWLACAMR